MIILTETTDKLQIVLGGAITTNQLQCFASYRDVTTTSITPARNGTNTNSTTDVSIVDSPASSTQRIIDYVSVYNNDTANAVVTIKMDFNGTEYILQKVTLGAQERLEYTDGIGWQVYTNSGGLKNSINQGTNATSSSLSTVVLSSDVTNNNAVANTLQDITGLTFGVTNGKTYYFRAVIKYTSAATTTGSRWTFYGTGGATFDEIYERVSYPLTATTETFSYVSAINTPASSNASSLTTGNVAIIEGFVRATNSGSFQLQFASEVSSSAVVAKQNSILQYFQVD